MPNPLINIGSAANDGTGELGPRSWLQKVNRLPNPDSMINAGSGDYSGTKEQKITAAIAAAALAGAQAVWVPQSLLPYNASLVTFNNAVQMEREGSQVDQFVVDVKAYGAAGDAVTDDSIAIRAAIIYLMNLRKTQLINQPISQAITLPAGMPALYIPPGRYLVTRQLHLIPGFHITGAMRYSGSVFVFDPNLANQYLFQLHLGATLPPTSEGYPDLTGQVAALPLGGFGFDNLTFEINAAHPNNNGCGMFFGNNYVVDGFLRDCWFNGGATWEVSEAGYTTYPYNLAVFRGVMQGFHVSGCFFESWTYVIDVGTLGDCTFTANWFNNCKGAFRVNGFCWKAIINGNHSYNNLGPWPEVSRFFFDLADTQAANAFYTQGVLLENNEVGCFEVNPTTPTSRIAGQFTQGLARISTPTASTRVRHIIRGNKAHVSGENYGTSASDPQTNVDAVGAIVLNGNADVDVEDNTIVLMGMNTVNLPPYALVIEAMAQANARIFVRGLSISAAQFTGIANKPRGILIRSTCTAGVIDLNDLTFDGEIQEGFDLTGPPTNQITIAGVYWGTIGTATDGFSYNSLFLSQTVPSTVRLSNLRTYNAGYAGQNTRWDVRYRDLSGHPQLGPWGKQRLSGTTLLTDNTVTSILRFTVPNITDQVGVYYFDYIANANLGGYYRWGRKAITITRLAGAATVAAIVTDLAEQTITNGGQAITVLTFAMGNILGAVGATQTVDLRITLSDGGNGGYVRFELHGMSDFYRPRNQNGEILVEMTGPSV